MNLNSLEGVFIHKTCLFFQ